MPVLPSEIPTGTVQGQFYFVSEDMVDADTDPSLDVVSGDVIFTCSAKRLRMPTKPATLIPLDFRAKFNSSGQLVSANDPSAGLELPATDSLLFNPTAFTWTVTFNLWKTSNKYTIPVEPFSFQVPEGQTVDLTTLMPVDTSPGVITIQGPQGIQGIPGVADDASVAALVEGVGPTATALDALYTKELAPISAVVYDPETGDVASITEGGITTTYTYNPDGTLNTETRLGKTRTRSYDGSGRLTGATVV